MQNSEIFQKTQLSAYTTKDYIFPSGKVVQVQGYEHRAIDMLLSSYQEDEIETSCGGNVPTIDYEFNGKRKYYPDLYIPRKNKIIEVKSDYTYNSDKERVDIKLRAALKQGYNIECWIFDKDDLIQVRYFG